MNSPTESSSKTSKTLQLEQFLPYRLMLVAEKVSESLARIYGTRFGIGNPEWRVLSCIGEGGTMTSTEIGRRGRMHKTKVSRAVSELESKGLLSRRVSQSDMRVAHLSLTPQGRATYDQIVPFANTFADDLISALSEDERRVFEKAVETLMARAEEVASRLEAEKG